MFPKAWLKLRKDIILIAPYMQSVINYLREYFTYTVYEYNVSVI